MKKIQPIQVWTNGARLQVSEASAQIATFTGATNGYIDISDGIVNSRIQNSGGLFIGTVNSYDLNLRTNATTRLTLNASTGAATFSSSVTAGGDILIGASASTIGALNFVKTGASPVCSRITFGTDGTGYSFTIAKNQSSTITDLFTLQDNGAATFSSTIQTAAPTGYSAQPWKLGDATSGTLTPNYYIKVEINGQIYSIPALQGTP